MNQIVGAGESAKSATEQAPFEKQAIALLNEDVAGYPLYVNEFSLGVKAAYVHDDGWGDGATGIWTPAKCWISK